MRFEIDVDNAIKEFKMRHDPVIIRVNKFNEESAKEFSTQISKAHLSGQTFIPIVIDSYGGQVYSLMSMIADLESATLPIVTVVSGKAMSCGAILFSFGDEGMRFMDKNATVLIHDVSTFAGGKIEELKADTEQADKLNKTVYQMMAKNCGKRPNYFFDIVHKRGHADWYLSAKEAQDHNLANTLGMPTFRISVGTEFELEE